MVTRKSVKDKAKDKEKTAIVKGKKPDPQWNVDRLEDAVVDGKFLGSIGDQLVVVRMRDGRMQKSLCIVKAFEEDRVNTWDDTRGQWFIFQPAEVNGSNVVIKKIMEKS